MAWRKRTLRLDDGREVEVECGETVCEERRGRWKTCPQNLPGGGCELFGVVKGDDFRPAACKRAERKALDKAAGIG